MASFSSERAKRHLTIRSATNGWKDLEPCSRFSCHCRCVKVWQSTATVEGGDMSSDGTAVLDKHIVTSGSMLVIEDVVSTVRGAIACLEDHGWVCDVVSTVAEAETRLRSNRYDLVLLDLSLPDS